MMEQVARLHNGTASREYPMTQHTPISLQEYGQREQDRERQGDAVQPCQVHVSIRERIHHFTWAWYALTMSTGGIAFMLHEAPYQFNGLYVIGTAVFILDLVLFLLITTIIISRFILFPGTFTHTLEHPTELLFIPTFYMTIASLIPCAERYGVPHTGSWLITALRVLFWLYLATSFLTAITQYHLLFTAKGLTVQSMTPAWILPILPTVLAGNVASAIAGSQPSHHAIPIIIAGFAFQGLGIIVTCLMYSNYLSRLMSYGLPSPGARAGMFIAVGPPSYTASAFIGMANAALTAFPETLATGTSNLPNAQVLKIVAVFVALPLWTLGLFFFSLSLAAVLSESRTQRFQLSWWSFVFPTVGFILATFTIGNAFQSEAILWTASVAAVLQFIMWIVVGVVHATAVWKGDICWPGKDEDRD